MFPKITSKYQFLHPCVSWRLQKSGNASSRFLTRLGLSAVEPRSKVLIKERWCPSTSALMPHALGVAAQCLIISK